MKDNNSMSSIRNNDNNNDEEECLLPNNNDNPYLNKNYESLLSSVREMDQKISLSSSSNRNNNNQKKNTKKKNTSNNCNSSNNTNEDCCICFPYNNLFQFVRAVPAVCLIALWNLMLSVPFGTMFFSEHVPLDSTLKETLGLKMSLMSLTVGQASMGAPLGQCLSSTAFTDTLTVWALAELAPFYHTLTDLCVSNHLTTEQIYPTTLYLMSLLTLVYSVLMFVAGKLGVGRLLSFFPVYVTLGLVAGIGLWAMMLSIDVSKSSNNDEDDSTTPTSLWSRMYTIHFGISLGLFGLVRLLRYVLPTRLTLVLDPIYFCSIPIVFYCILSVCQIPYPTIVDLTLQSSFLLHHRITSKSK